MNDSQPPRPKLFVSYAHADETDGGWKTKLLPTLRALRTGGVIEFFEDQMIDVGDEWDERLSRELDAYDLIVFLVSTSFLASGYIETVEVERALARHEAKNAHILPILVKPCDWTYRDWAKVQAYPRYGPDPRPLSFWESKGELDEALTQISQNIRAWAMSWHARHPLPAQQNASFPTTPPYRGLFAFQPENEDDFFGRADLTDTLWTAVSTNRLTLLTGASGSGKSSLVNAGIIPRLDPALWCIARTRLGETPIDNLANKLVEALMPDADDFTVTRQKKEIRKELGDDPTAIVDYAETHKSRKGRSLLLVLDQFEETFNLAKTKNRKQHESLIDLLLAIARGPDQGPVKALLAMRSDFMAALQDDRPELVEALQPATVLMRRMKPGEWAEAIEGPARRRNVTVEPSLLATLVDEVNRNPDALPLLEATLETLWAGRTGDTLELNAYEALDGLAGALVKRAEKALATPAIPEAEACRLFLELVRIDPQGGIDNVTRQPRSRAHLDAIDPDLWQVGMLLTAPELRLLVTSRDPAAGTETLDIAHEALFRQWPRLADWIAEERDFLLFAQRLDQRLADFTESGGHPDYHLPQSDLRTAQDWQEAHGKTFHRDQQAYITKSAAFWAADAADDGAKALWGRLELSFEDWRRMPEHDRDGLAALVDAEGDTRRRFLALATSDADAARKLNRQPALVLRAALGLDPVVAAELGAPPLAVADGKRAFAADLAWLTMARHLLPIVLTHPTTIVERALDLIAKTTSPTRLQALTQNINAVADKLDPTMAASTVQRALELAAKTTDPHEFQALAQAIAAMADKLDPTKARDAAAGIVQRALDLAAETTDGRALQPLARAIAAVADKPDPTMTRDAAASMVERAVEFFASETTNPFQPDALARAIAAVADKLDPTMAVSTVDRALELAAKTADPYQLDALAQAIAAMADRLDPTIARDVAASMVDRALDLLAAKTTDPYKLDALGRAIAGVADKLDATMAASTVERAVGLLAANPPHLALYALAQAITAVIDKLESSMAASTVERALELAAKTADPYQLYALAQAIGAMVDKLDPTMARDAAVSIVNRALDLLSADTTNSFQLQPLALAIAAMADKLDTITARDAAISTVDRALDLAAKTTELDQLHTLAQAIAAVADKLDASMAASTVDRALDLAAKTTIGPALSQLALAIEAMADKLDPTKAASVVERVLVLAAKTLALFELQPLAQAMAAMAPRLALAPVLLAAINMMKLPPGGDEKVTDTLLRTITTALNRPDLLRPFPEQSFWAVMQHLAELKAANPDWDWLDLARKPLPPDELVGRFRRLSAEPPDWPGARPA